MTLQPTQEELFHLHRRRLTQQLWKDFSPVKQSMEWYKHNTPTLSPFVIDYYDSNSPVASQYAHRHSPVTA